MTRLATLLLTGTLALSAQAIRPRPVPYTVTQSDGTTLTVVKHGNDHLAFYTTQDGKILVRNADGDLCYARLDGDLLRPTAYIAHNAAQRAATEQTFARDSAITPTRLATLKAETTPRSRKAIQASTSDGLGKYGTSGKGAVGSIGTYTIPVIMVQFSDLKFQSSTTVEKMNRFYNEAGYSDESGCVGSVRDYFVSQSRGMFTPTFEIVGIVTLSNSYKTYGANDSYGQDKGWQNYAFLKDCVNAAAAQGVDFAQYVHGSGVPLVALLYAGAGEATDYSSNAENYLWPAEDDCDIDINGVHFNSVFMGNELYYDGSLMGMGVFCHEFGHALGMPDFYCTDYSYEADDAFGFWDIMDCGAYVNSSRAPIGYTAYERSYLGWLNLVELGSEAQKVTLNKADDADGTNAVIIRNSRSETFILENRQPGTWYPSSFGSGIMLQRYTYSQAAWSQNIPNNTQSKKRACLLPANNVKFDYGTNVSPRNLYGNGVNEITSLPTYSGTAKTDAPIYDITKSGSDITFYWLSTDISPYTVGDTLEQDGLTSRYAGNLQLLVEPKADGAYTGEVQIPDTFTRDGLTYTYVGIDSLAFANCNGLTAVSIPATVTQIAADAFRHTPALKQIVVAAGNEAFQSVDGVLFTRSTLLDEASAPTVRPRAATAAQTATFNFGENTLGLPVSTSASPSAGNITDPITVDDVTLTTSSGTTATRLWKSTSTTDLRVYKDGGSLTFSVPDRQQIEQIAFTYSALNMTASEGTLTGGTWTGETQSVTFSANATCKITKVVVTYSAAAPAEAALLHYPAARDAEYTVPTVVSRLADYAFEDAAVSTLVLSDSLLTLGANALSTAALTSLTCPATTPPTAVSDPFTTVDKSLCTLTVPAEAEAAYRAANYWKEFFPATGIATVTAPAAGSSARPCFDLSGRRVSRTSRGVYILGGRKIVVP